MRVFVALTATIVASFLVASVALERHDAPQARPRILSAEVINAKAVMMTLPQFSEPTRVHVVGEPVVRLLARVEGLDRLDILVVINSRSNTGHFPGRFLGEDFVVIEVPLPDVGSEWLVPGPGADSPMQVLTIDGAQVYLLQVVGDAGPTGMGYGLMVQSPPVLVVRGR